MSQENLILTTAQKIRTECEQAALHSSYFNGELAGMCAIASAKLWKALKRIEVPALIHILSARHVIQQGEYTTTLELMRSEILVQRDRTLPDQLSSEPVDLSPLVGPLTGEDVEDNDPLFIQPPFLIE